MVLHYTQFGLINFPIFGLPSDDLDVTDGLLRLGHLVVDDRNQIGDSLGKRRLQTFHQLFKLHACYEDITGLIRAKHKVFVDNKGYCFIYEKTKFCKVKYHRIIKEGRKEVATVLKVSTIPFPVIVKRPPPLGKTWIGMLYLDNKPWIPYEYAETKCTTTRRKI
jgi:hypothetical protein